MPAGVFKETYLADMALLRYPIHWTSLGIGAVLLLAFPLIAGNYGVNTAVSLMIFFIGAIGLNIVTGLAGQISLAHGALMGVGAYTAAYLANNGVNILLAIPVAAITAAIVGAVLALPSFRLKGYYLAMASIAVQEILEYMFKTWIDPDQGITISTSSKNIMGIYLGNGMPLYYTVLGIAVLAVIVAANVGRSGLGRAMKAVRDNDVSAQVVGINVPMTKALAFTIGSLYAGLAGALYVLANPGIGYGAFGLDASIEFLAIVLVGGAGRIVWGSLLGALVIHTGWSLLASAFSADAATKYIVLGGLIAVFVIAEPEGLIGLLRRVKEYFRLWPFRY
ncbi:branched-chain amino acid ABC transporter permease [Pyrofollis japonicus]|uniref:branched-chain amino acid ABC transporter permease n=1 Tax=Pyrofollis japonicus TaxID=3060460 RepID=UPI00295B3BB8|nr:branched-chain amino acid ABC transporter permease [Pyrofollis japonicus]BEP16929.1 branched-chain amino acid ABC transporter permease [Pyrofollis japonicus]